jgi:hypothetical protein
MNLKELISPATHTSGRSLLVVSAVVLLSRAYSYPLSKFPIVAIAVDIPDNMVTTAAGVMLVFLTATHVLNWYND